MKASDLYTLRPVGGKRPKPRRRNAKTNHAPRQKRLYSPNVAQITRKDDRKFYSDRAPIRNVLN